MHCFFFEDIVSHKCAYCLVLGVCVCVCVCVCVLVGVKSKF